MSFDLPFPNCNLSSDWTENQTSFESDISNSGNKLHMFKNRGIHFIHLNVDNLLPKKRKYAILRR